MSIDKALLFAMLAKKMDDLDLFDRLPPHKTLFACPPGKGLPIGNLNSQFFANVYLNGLDQFIKHTLKCRWYLPKFRS
jgi:RNA-directed DNA polymerase